MFKFLTAFLFSFSALYAQVAPPEPLVAEGKTMGTTYRVIYFDHPQDRDFKASIDSVLTALNNSINTYDASSEISKFNRSRRGICTRDYFLRDILGKSIEIYRASEGAFDPTVMPLVNAWGFGPEKSYEPSRSKIDSLKDLVGLDKIRMTRKRIRKVKKDIQLDMGGIGQGYGADVIYNLLKGKGIRHMLVELGGEGIALGRNLKKDKPWTIGILDPNSTPDNQFFKAYVTLNDEAFTTSGNYFNYRIVEGRKFGHTINPVTGYPAEHSLLSASVFAAECATADGWATAFMVMGIEKAQDKIKSIPGLEAILLYSDKDGSIKQYITPGIAQQVTLE